MFASGPRKGAGNHCAADSSWLPRRERSCDQIKLRCETLLPHFTAQTAQALAPVQSLTRPCGSAPASHLVCGVLLNGTEGSSLACLALTASGLEPLAASKLAQVLQGPRCAGPPPSPLSLLPQRPPNPAPGVPEIPEMALEEGALYAEPRPATAVPQKPGAAPTPPPGSAATAAATATATGPEAQAVAMAAAVEAAAGEAEESVAERGRVCSPKMSVETKRQRMCPHSPPHSPQECKARGTSLAESHLQSGREHTPEEGSGATERPLHQHLGSPVQNNPGAPCIPCSSMACMDPFSLHPDTPERPEASGLAPVSPGPSPVPAPDTAMEALCIALAAPQLSQSSQGPEGPLKAAPGIARAETGAGTERRSGTGTEAGTGAGTGARTETQAGHGPEAALRYARAARYADGAGYASSPASEASSSGSGVGEHRQGGEAGVRQGEPTGERASSSQSGHHHSQQQDQHQGMHQSQQHSQQQALQQGQHQSQQRVRGARAGREGDIFRAALDGDLQGLQRCLHASPSSINAKKSSTWQTPLHCAAASGRCEALELLTHWTGEESANLEARNTYGETPLHVAAKNCSPDAVHILLQAGACAAAQTTNGMTALHLAVWSTGSSEDTETARLLLTAGAPLECKDKDGRTPMDLVPRGNSSMAALLAHHMRLEQASKAQASLASPEGARRILQELEGELRRIVGVPELKAQLRRWAKGVLLDQRRRSLGLDIRPQQAPHMAFMGNPGTGKTSVARALSRLLHRVGVVAQAKLVEVQRTDLVGEFVGHTGPKTRAVIERAKGGVLFVDEAYRLVPAFKAGEKDYGLEALEEIMAAMDGGDLVVILAGYKEPMRRVFDANEGLRRRVARCFEFEDLSCSDIARVMMLKMEGEHAQAVPGSDAEMGLRSATGALSAGPQEETPNPLQGFRLHRECTEESLAGLVAAATSEEQRQRHNGALALTALVAARGHLDARLDVECADPEELVSIRLSDISAGLQQVSC